MLEEYHETITEYVGILGAKANEGILEIEDYYWLTDKLSEWMAEYERKLEGGEL